jgi:F-type H+-transporting ATPase subunit delta
VEEIAAVYANALFEVAKQQGLLPEVREQLREFAKALDENRDLTFFFFSPYFSNDEKKEGLHKAVEDAEPVFMNFLEALIERSRMPAIFRIRDRYEKLWDEEEQVLPVEVTSAIDLEEDTVESIADQIREQTGKKVEISSRVDPEIIGGIVLRVGNSILDASIRNRLNQLRRQVAQA